MIYSSNKFSKRINLSKFRATRSSVMSAAVSHSCLHHAAMLSGAPSAPSPPAGPKSPNGHGHVLLDVVDARSRNTSCSSSSLPFRLHEGQHGRSHLRLAGRPSVAIPPSYSLPLATSRSATTSSGGPSPEHGSGRRGSSRSCSHHRDVEAVGPAPAPSAR
ncbi:hypothetical protein E2562_017024 [Oryza meyeriana var. granulata]|uniref:Uncharacterized protein n=1 Tax=Oryza meyeriana var. granulata TaxID=110450 RepID=A0A6G1EAR7_9ORYZ|nr:hypothetical protein E2562_017024 [Oryza meyeriana var. granulata]